MLQPGAGFHVLTGATCVRSLITIMFPAAPLSNFLSPSPLSRRCHNSYSHDTIRLMSNHSPRTLISAELEIAW